MPTVVELQNPNALASEQLVAFLRRAFEGGTIAPGGLDACAQDIWNMVQSPQCHVLVGAEGGDFKALTLVTMPQDQISPYPFIIHFYNEGSAELREQLMEELLDVIVSNGYTKAWAINGSGHSDEAWAKVLVPGEAKVESIGTIFQLEVT